MKSSVVRKAKPSFLVERSTVDMPDSTSGCYEVLGFVRRSEDFWEGRVWVGMKGLIKAPSLPLKKSGVMPPVIVEDGAAFVLIECLSPPYLLSVFL